MPLTETLARGSPALDTVNLAGMVQPDALPQPRVEPHALLAGPQGIVRLTVLRRQPNIELAELAAGKAAGLARDLRGRDQLIHLTAASSAEA